jgi:hypothetical protein
MDPPPVSIDNEGDWKFLSEYAGIAADGTLWCWSTALNDLLAFKMGLTDGKYPKDRPFLISEDTDWVSVSSNATETFAIKADGSLWAFGANDRGSLGIGLCGFNQFSDFWLYRYRARLSCPVQSVVLDRPDIKFTRKPTAASLRFYATDRFSMYPPEIALDDTQLGQGVVLEVEWTGSVSDDDVQVTSGGQGYTSRPEVRLTPSHDDDEGKEVVGSVTEMTKSSVLRFDVKNSGSGYTYAIAAEVKTGATATADVENGEIVGWTIENPGDPVSPVDAGSVSVEIVGDGSGAEAEAVFAGSQVVKVSFPAEKIWEHKPNVTFSGGGGSGAAAVVAEIYGNVDAVHVIESGSGYTQTADKQLRVYFTPDPEDSYWAEDADLPWGQLIDCGYAVLAPGHVRDIVQVDPSVEIPLKKQSGGVLHPFSFNIIKGSECKIVSPSAGDRLLLVQEDDYGGYFAALDEPLEGYDYPPFLEVASPADVRLPQGSLYRTRTENVRDGVCIPPGTPQPRSFVVSISESWGTSEEGIGWPYAGQQYILSSADGRASVTLENIDGTLRAVSRTWATEDVDPSKPFLASEAMDQNLGNAEWSPHEPERYGGPVTGGFSPLTPYWTPPTIDEKVMLHFSPPTHGGTGAVYGEAYPTNDNIAGPPVVIVQGGLYTVEPESYATSVLFVEPVQIPGSWRSVSTTYGGERTVAVSSGGELFWWGINSANSFNLLSQTPCPSPAPVGKGVAASWVSAREKGDLTERFGSYVGPPQHGVHITAGASFTFGYGYSLAYLHGGPPAKALKKSTAGLSGNNEYFPIEDVVVSFGGLGYTASPEVKNLGINRSYNLTARLMQGPSSFTDSALGSYARADDGTWYEIAPYRGYSIVRGDSLYNYVETSVDGIHRHSGDHDNVTRFTRERTEVPLPGGHYVAWISESGSGYENGRLKVTTPPFPFSFSRTEETTTERVECGSNNGGSVAVSWTTVVRETYE